MSASPNILTATGDHRVMRRDRRMVDWYGRTQQVGAPDSLLTVPNRNGGRSCWATGAAAMLCTQAGLLAASCLRRFGHRFSLGATGDAISNPHVSFINIESSLGCTGEWVGKKCALVLNGHSGLPECGSVPSAHQAAQERPAPRWNQAHELFRIIEARLDVRCTTSFVLRR